MSTPTIRPPGWEDFLWTPLVDGRRWLFAATAAVSAIAHIPVIAPHLREAPYMGEEFIVLTVGCLLIAAAALYLDSPAVYAAATLACGLAVVGYTLTRLVPFPDLADDVGNWLEPLGVVSVLAESATIGIAVSVLVRWRRRR